MHEKWAELISFYVAGSLSPEQAYAVEQHLSGCESCRQSLAEWQMISSAVRAEATAWSRRLPPLSPEVRAAVNQRRPGLPPLNIAQQTLPVPQVRRTPATSRRAWVPLTALAAMLTVVLLGVLLAYVSDQNNDRDATQVAMLSVMTETQAERNRPASPTPLASPRSGQSDLGILAPPTSPPVTEKPEIVPSPTRVAPRPTTTPPPPPTPIGTLGIGGATGLTTFSDVCSVTTVGGANVSLYAAPDTASRVVGTITGDQSLLTYVRSENGWYQIVEIGPGILGWAPGSTLSFSGPCADLPLPTPTLSAGVCNGFTFNARIEIRSGPGDSYSVIDTITLSERVEVTALSDNGWVRIRRSMTPTPPTGWMPATMLSMNGDCANLPTIPVATVEPPTTTPMPTDTPAPPPGRITAFNTSVAAAAPGDSITVTWETSNTQIVWVEYYGIDRQTAQSSARPIATLPNAATSGTWTVTIPPDFTWSGARFVIIVDNYDNGLGIPRAEVVVSLE